MTQALTYQCPNCQGTLRFDSVSGQLVCDFCDSRFAPEAIEELYAQRQAAADQNAAAEAAAQGQPAVDQNAAAAAKAQGQPAAIPVPSETNVTAPSPAQGAPGAQESSPDPVAAYLAHAQWDQLPEDQVAALNCTSCGAQLLVEKTTAATTCPYCGNHSIVAGQLAGALKPDYVIPFKLDKQAAVAALKRFYGDKKLLPNTFTKDNHIEEVTGLYVPFWLYTGQADATVGMNAQTTRTWVDPKNTYVETSHFQVMRQGVMQFQRVPVDASTKMPDEHMDSIEPFDYNELVPFSVGYLPGFVTDRFDQDSQMCADRAKRRVQKTCSDTLRNTVSGYATVEVTSTSADMALDDISYVLLPVWMLHTRWNGQDFLFAMNGQTGKMVGDLPIDKGKSVRLFLLWFLPAVVVMLVFVWVVFGFGY